MKTLDEIIDEVKTNGTPSYDELKYSLLAMTYLMNSLTMKYNKLLCGEMSEFMINRLKNEKSEYGKVLSMSPKDYIG